MGQHTELVNRRRKVLNAEVWAKKVASISMLANKDGKKIWTTTYNDGSVDKEHWKEGSLKVKEKTTSPLLTIDECIDQMFREEVDAAIHRN
jgi:hypothetical protein